LVKTTRPWRLGNGGERWWPTWGKRARFGRLGPSREARVYEDDHHSEAKLVGLSGSRGDGRGCDDRKQPGARVSATSQEEGNEGEKELGR
jgi:hypothetical protein